MFMLLRYITLVVLWYPVMTLTPEMITKRQGEVQF